MKIVAWCVAGVVLLGVGAIAWLYFVPPESYVPPVRESKDETSFAPGELVGWYEDDRGERWMVTWTVPNGLSLNRLEEPARFLLEPVSRDSWKTDEKTSLTVARGESGAVESLQWSDGEGERRVARRLEDYGYTQREVRFGNGDVELAGMLMSPVDPGPHPGVAFIHGSGVSDRNSYWYLYQADYLARRGVVVLLPDKRGCGKSGGQWHVASFEDFAGDAVAAVELLSAQAETDPERVGLLGISQGGWIAPLAASRSTAVRFVVNLSGSATTPDEQLRHEIRADIRNGGAPGFVASLFEPLFTRRVKRRRQVWWDHNQSFDPLSYWSGLELPVLVVYGRLDEDDNVPIQRSIELLEPLAKRSGGAEWTFHVYDNLGHGMIDASTGWIREEYLQQLHSWIASAGAVTDCESLAGPIEQIECYVDHATRTGDPEICREASHEGLRYQCFAVVAEKRKDAALCDTIPLSSDEHLALRDVCLSDVAATLEDAALCERIETAGLRDSCYFKIARATDDPSLCNRIVDLGLRSGCPE